LWDAMDARDDEGGILGIHMEARRGQDNPESEGHRGAEDSQELDRTSNLSNSIEDRPDW
jgi:hypothetical protein